MTQIANIIGSIADVEVSSQTKTPVVYELNNAVSNIKGTPARLVFPMQVAQSDGGVERVSFGSRPTLLLDWAIADLMLYNSVKKGSTIHSSLMELAVYAGNYTVAFQGKMKLLPGVTIEKIMFEWNEFRFPQGSDSIYYGCLVTHQIKEILE